MKHLLLPSPLPLHLLHRPSKPLLLLHAHARGRRIRIPSAASNGSSGEPSPVASEPPSTDATSSPPPPSSVKNRLLAMNQARRVQLDASPAPVTPKKKKKKKDAAASAPATRRERQRGPKQWEEMSLAEKAVELYVGEKGLLFWLNKFAYASIFIMVGAWVLFRFVGPSLGLYQLDAPPLAPTAVLGG